MKQLRFIALLLLFPPMLAAQDFQSSVDTLALSDSVMVIHTVCAPICSSVVIIYDRQGQRIGRLWPDIVTPFPQAVIENGRIVWKDNQAEMMDEEEKKTLPQPAE